MSHFSRLAPFLGPALMIFGGFIIFFNWLALWQTWRTEKFCSRVPLIGTLFLGAGLLVYPPTRYFAWIAPLVDYGTLEMILILPNIFRQIFEISSFNLLREYSKTNETKTVSLKLFRKHIFTLHQKMVGPLRLNTICECTSSGSWQRNGALLTLRMRESNETATFDISTSQPEVLRQTSAFPSHEKTGPELSLEGLELVLARNKES